LTGGNEKTGALGAHGVEEPGLDPKTWDLWEDTDSKSEEQEVEIIDDDLNICLLI
jgi:hypothetical protein